MSGKLNQVIDLHKKMDFAYAGPPRDLPEAEKKHRIKQLREEVDEYEDAATNAERLDALIDLIYFALGAIHRHGYEYQFAVGFQIVHDANMKKEVGENPTRPGFGKDLIKPEGWTPPNLEVLFDDAASL